MLKHKRRRNAVHNMEWENPPKHNRLGKTGKYNKVVLSTTNFRGPRTVFYVVRLDAYPCT